MLNVIVEFGLRGEGVREYGCPNHQDQVYTKISRRLPYFKDSSKVSSRFPYTSGLCSFVVYAWLRFASLRFGSRGRFNLASPATDAGSSSFYGLVCSTRFVANDGFATTVSSLVGFSRVSKLQNATYCALRVSSLFAYRGIGYDWNSEDWHR